jgi:hypothetical protein
MFWSDTRPILMEFVCGGSRTATNPHCYLADGQLNVSNATDFAQRLAGRAQSILDVAASVDAQGVVVWDLDGIDHGLLPAGQGDHDFTYVGNPMRIAQFSAEMHAVADNYFTKLKSTGLRVGVTLRPQTFGMGTTLPPLTDPVGVFYKTDAPLGSRYYSRDRIGYSDREAARQYTGPWKQGGAYDPAIGLTDSTINWSTDGSATGANRQHHLSAADAQQKLLDEIAYCKTRWGLTLFYVDTNVNLDGTSLNASVFDAIHAAHPDVLLLPEWDYVYTGGGYYRSTVPYQQANMGRLSRINYSTPPEATYEVAGAQSFIVLKDLAEEDYQLFKPEMARQLKDGKIILGAKWFDTTEMNHLRDLKAAADTLAPDEPPATGNLYPATYAVSNSYGYTGASGTGAGMRDGLDNASNTIWAAEGGAGGIITADLGSNQTVTRLVLRQGGTYEGWQDTPLGGVEVWYQAVGGPWIQATTVGGSAPGVDVEIDMNDVLARYVELRRYSWFALSEFRVYVVGAVPPPPPATTTSLFLTSTYTVTSTYDSYTGHTGDGAGMRDSLDNAANTVWAAEDGSGGNITCSLGSNKTVDHIVVAQIGTFDGWQGTTLSNTGVWYRPTGGGSWTQKGTISTSSPGTDVTFDMGGVTAAEIELRKTTWFGLSKFAVYVVDTAPPPPPPPPPTPTPTPTPSQTPPASRPDAVTRKNADRKTRKGLPKLRTR